MNPPSSPKASTLLLGMGLLRDIGRLQTIATVMIRFGFVDVVQRLGLAQALASAGKVLRWESAEQAARLPAPERIRLALQALGPTFIKAGQIMATRADLFGPELIAEFEKLQDKVEAQPFEELRGQLTEDLGAPPEEIFAAIDPTPLACASIGQVHRARLQDGSEVILKIRHPGIRAVIEADLRLLTRLAEVAERELPALARYHPLDMVAQFAASLRQELDLAAECGNAERIANSFAGDPHIRIPAVHWEWTCERLNVQEYIAGIPGRDIPAMLAAGLDPRLIARRGGRAVLKMILEDGFFHADPHPGNLLVLPDGGIAFLDFGMVGRLTETRRNQVVRMLLGLTTRDARATTRVLLEWAGDAPIEPEQLQSEVEAFIDRYHGVPLKSLDLTALLGDVTGIFRRHEIALPADLVLLIKAMTTLDGLARQLDPEFQVVEEAAPFLRDIFLESMGPDVLLKKGWQTLAGSIDALAGLLPELQRSVQAARRGKLKLNVELTPPELLGAGLDRAANRLAVGLVTAALIIAGAIMAGSAGDPGWLGPSLFAGALGGGLWLALSIWRSGRR